MRDEPTWSPTAKLPAPTVSCRTALRPVLSRPQQPISEGSWKGNRPARNGGPVPPARRRDGTSRNPAHDLDCASGVRPPSDIAAARTWTISVQHRRDLHPEMSGGPLVQDGAAISGRRTAASSASSRAPSTPVEKGLALRIEYMYMQCIVRRVAVCQRGSEIAVASARGGKPPMGPEGPHRAAPITRPKSASSTRGKVCSIDFSPGRCRFASGVFAKAESLRCWAIPSGPVQGRSQPSRTSREARTRAPAAGPRGAGDNGGCGSLSHCPARVGRRRGSHAAVDLTVQLCCRGSLLAVVGIRAEDCGAAVGSHRTTWAAWRVAVSWGKACLWWLV